LRYILPRMPDHAPAETEPHDDAELEPAEPGPVPTYWSPPVCAFDWAGAILTPGFLAALAAAQADVETVGKTAQNTDQNYAYAPGDALVGEIRRSFAPHGIAFLVSWRTFDRPWKIVSERGGVCTQWLDFEVVLDWALTFGDAEAKTACRLTGTANLVAIGSAGRPPDKSVLAARTELAGAVAIGLGAIDRAKPPADQDVGSREGDGDARPGASRGRVLTTEARDRYNAAIRRLVAARKAAGHKIGGKVPDPLSVLADLGLGEGFRVECDADADRVVAFASAAFNRLREDLAGSGGA
jgi:hypothetical protein